MNKEGGKEGRKEGREGGRKEGGREAGRRKYGGNHTSVRGFRLQWIEFNLHVSAVLSQCIYNTAACLLCRCLQL